MSSFSAADDEALRRPPFGIRNKIRRVIWGVVWLALFRTSPVPLHAWRSFLLRIFGAKIGGANHIYPGARIWAPWLLQTGELVTIGPRAEVYNPGGVRLGDYTIISQDAYLCGATHDFNKREFPFIAKIIETGPHVWICAKAIVLPGVHAEEGSVLGAGSVMSKRMKAWTVFAGNPAVAVKERKWEDAAPEV